MTAPAAAEGAGVKARVDEALGRVEDVLDVGGVKKDIALVAVSAIALAASFLTPVVLPFDPGWIAVACCGLPIVIRAVVALITEFDVKADVLVSIALVASVVIGEVFAAGEVALIMQLGGLLEELTVARARAGIERLVGLTPRTARIVREDGAEEVVSADDVSVGDVLRVLPGETVPVDGAIVHGRTSIDQAVMTGESLPVDKGPGDEVSSGTLNQFGAFDMRAVRVGCDSSIQRMVALVQSADADKARIVSIADRWATWVVVGALSAAAVTWLVTGEVLRAVTILVVFCPCALVLATPTAIMGAIGNATNHGFLVREGDALERLSMVKRFAFDKTGTLTYGRPQVREVRPFSDALTADELYAVTAAAELRSEHPLGRAIVAGYRETVAGSAGVPSPKEFAMVPGRGVEARVGGRHVVAGSVEMLHEAGARPPAEAREEAQVALDDGCTLVHVAVDGADGVAYAGFIALADEMRAHAASTIAAIRTAGVEPVLLTGDNVHAATGIAGDVGIAEVHAACLPTDKLAYIEEAEVSGVPVCMVGDGVNDAPALKHAFVGIALGGVGSDIAVDAADIVLVDDAIDELPHLLSLSQHMMRVIRANLTFSMALNFVAVALAVAAVLDPVSGALVHNCGSVFVIVNSALLLRWRSRPGTA